MTKKQKTVPSSETLKLSIAFLLSARGNWLKEDRREANSSFLFGDEEGQDEDAKNIVNMIQVIVSTAEITTDTDYPFDIDEITDKVATAIPELEQKLKRTKQEKEDVFGEGLIIKAANDFAKALAEKSYKTFDALKEVKASKSALEEMKSRGLNHLHKAYDSLGR